MIAIPAAAPPWSDETSGAELFVSASDQGFVFAGFAFEVGPEDAKYRGIAASWAATDNATMAEILQS